MMNALRLIDGVEQSIFEERTHISRQDIQSIWDELVALDLVSSDRCTTTPLGLRYLTACLSDFYNRRSQTLGPAPIL